MTREKASEILDGFDSNQDIHQLLAFTSNLETSEPDETFLILATAWIEKYGIQEPQFSGV